MGFLKSLLFVMTTAALSAHAQTQAMTPGEFTALEQKVIGTSKVCEARYNQLKQKWQKLYNTPMQLQIRWCEAGAKTSKITSISEVEAQPIPLETLLTQTDAAKTDFRQVVEYKTPEVCIKKGENDVYSLMHELTHTVSDPQSERSANTKLINDKLMYVTDYFLNQSSESTAYIVEFECHASAPDAGASLVLSILKAIYFENGTFSGSRKDFTEAFLRAWPEIIPQYFELGARNRLSNLLALDSNISWLIAHREDERRELVEKNPGQKDAIEVAYAASITRLELMRKDTLQEMDTITRALHPSTEPPHLIITKVQPKKN
jgi:hypothetical protein